MKTPTRVSLAALAATATIVGPAGSALACNAPSWNQRNQAPQAGPAERSVQARAHTAQVRTWQEELVRHRFH
jgi:hypothetical protein